MSTYIVHIKGFNRSWVTRKAEGDTFAEAAVKAVVERNKAGGLDLDSIPHAVAFEDGECPRVVFTETEPREVFDPLILGGWGYSKPGNRWFSERVREGRPDDCLLCGGTGVDAYNPFRQCGGCGDPDLSIRIHGEASGKAPVGSEA